MFKVEHSRDAAVMTSPALLLTRIAFALVDHLAPRLAGRVAFHFFSRTPRVSGSRARQVIAEARSFMDGARHHCLQCQGVVVAHEFRPEVEPEGMPRNALVLHGWGSRTEHMRVLIEALLKEGLRVVALDLPGHGQSGGRHLHMGNAVAAVASVAQWFGPFTAVIGHSFGGAVALNAAAGSVRGLAPIAAERLVLIAAPSSLPAAFERFGRFLNLGARAQTALADRVEVITGRPLENFVGAVQLAEIRLPTLIVHAPDDKEVPFADARAFEKAGPHAVLMRAPGLGHRRILADRLVAGRIARFATGCWTGRPVYPAYAA
jgi:pimeloyl-ACP methyl ester carboxylesterase